MKQVHPAAQTGFSAASATYVSGRPGYPAALNGWLADILADGAGKRIVDLGAGTGKFTAVLVATGAEVIAVEPVQPMRERLQYSFPAISALNGTADRIPLKSASVDAVFCAQSFHWFATVEALREIARVLIPGGVLGLIWNVRDETCDWVSALSRIILPYEENTPRFYQNKWRSVFPAEGFSELQELTFGHDHQGDFQTVVIDRMMSISFIASLPQEKRNDVERQLRGLLNSFPELRHETTISFPYQTFVVWCKKL